MKSTLTTKLAAATGLTALVLGGLVPPVAQADPIEANNKSPYAQLVGVGSDTLQDVDNGLSKAIGRVSTNGLWKLASYDATASVRFAPNADSSVARPNGSGDGLEALLVSIGQVASNDGKAWFDSSTVYWKSDGSADDVVGDIHYSRSSSTPTVVETGAVNYIPFAKDAVTFATRNGKFPALSIGTVSDTADEDGVAESSLFAIYRCEATAIVTNKAGVPQKLVKKSVYTEVSAANGGYNSATENLIDIAALLPQEASGTSQFWAKYFMGAAKPTMANFPCVSRTIVDQDASDAATDADDVNDSVQEHSGAALITSGSITPFSIPKWIGMAKDLPGVTDVRNSATLGSITVGQTVIAPTTGSGKNMVLNPTFLTNTTTDDITRTIFHVVPHRLVTDETTLEYAMFNGTDSLVCQEKATIREYGFGLMTGVDENECGAVFDTLRAAAFSDVTVATKTITNDEVNGTFDVSVDGLDTVGGRDNGAKVRLIAYNPEDAEDYYYFDSQYDGIMVAGQDGVDFTVPFAGLPDEGEWDLGLVVIPNNAGAETFVSATNLATKSISAVEVEVTVAKGKVNKAGRAVVTVSPATTGVVNVYKDSNNQLLGTRTITTGGTVTITLTKQRKKGNYPLYVVFEGNAQYAASSAGAIWRVK